MSKSFLFICSANKKRSKTAEDYFSKKFPDLNFKSAGTNRKICFQENTNYLSKTDLEEADIVFVMEQHHENYIYKNFNKTFSAQIIILQIKDHFNYYQKELIEILEKRVEKYF